MFERWNEIDWKSIEESDIPPVERAWFETLVNAKSTPVKAQNAMRLIALAVFDQGCVVPHTSALAIGLFADALRAGCRAPVDVLHAIGDMAGASARFDALDGFDRNAPGWAPVFADPACHAVITSVESIVDLLLPFLEDKGAKVRAAAAYAVAFSAPRSKETLAALRARLAREKDPGAAASMLLALANHIGYAKEAADELVSWTRDDRELVALAAALAVARRVDGEAALAAAAPVLRAADRITRVAPSAAQTTGKTGKTTKVAAKKSTKKAGASDPFEALPVPAFRFAGGDADALALAALARLGPRNTAIAARLLTLLDDETPLGGYDWFVTRTTSRIVAAAIGGAMPQGKVGAPSELDGGSRAMLEAFAVRPWVWWPGVRVPQGVPGGRLALARWLGLRPPRHELLARHAGDHGPLGTAIKNLLDDSGPLEPATAAIASAVPGEDALDLVEDLCASAATARELPWFFEPAHHDRSTEQIRRQVAENGRRHTRTLLLACGVLRARGADIVPHLRRTVRGIVGHATAPWEAGTVGALAWAALDALGGQEPIPDAFWSSAKHVMSCVELTPVFSAALGRIPVEERIIALQLTLGSGPQGDASDAWRYADRIPLDAIPSLVARYSMRPDDTIFPAILERMRAEGLGKEIDSVLAWAVERFGTPPFDNWSTPAGIYARSFSDSGGRAITIFVAPTPSSNAMLPPSWPRASG